MRGDDPSSNDAQTPTLIAGGDFNSTIADLQGALLTPNRRRFLKIATAAGAALAFPKISLPFARNAQNFASAAGYQTLCEIENRAYIGIAETCSTPILRLMKLMGDHINLVEFSSFVGNDCRDLVYDGGGTTQRLLKNIAPARQAEAEALIDEIAQNPFVRQAAKASEACQFHPLTKDGGETTPDAEDIWDSIANGPDSCYKHFAKNFQHYLDRLPKEGDSVSKDGTSDTESEIETSVQTAQEKTDRYRSDDSQDVFDAMRAGNPAHASFAERRIKAAIKRWQRE